MPKTLTRDEVIATRNAARIYDERMHGIASEFKPSVRVAWLSTVIFKAGAEINTHMADHNAYCKHVDEIADAMKKVSRIVAQLSLGNGVTKSDITEFVDLADEVKEQSKRKQKELDKDELPLHKIKWGYLGHTEAFNALKNDIQLVTSDVQGFIKEIAINDICQTFLKHGYIIIKENTGRGEVKSSGSNPK